MKSLYAGMASMAAAALMTRRSPLAIDIQDENGEIRHIEIPDREVSDAELTDLITGGMSVRKDGEHVPLRDVMIFDETPDMPRDFYEEFADLLVPGYTPQFDMPRKIGFMPELAMPYSSPVRSGGQQKHRDVMTGRAAEKRARKARAVTRKNRK